MIKTVFAGIVPSPEGAVADGTLRNDAFAHCKFIGDCTEAQPLFDKTGLAEQLDEGCVLLTTGADANSFIEALGQVRFWPRELKVDLDAKT